MQRGESRMPYSVIRRNPSGHLSEIHESAYVDQTAILCGKVVVQENVFIGPYAMIRADEVNAEGDMEPIVIGVHSNTQDGVVIHSKSGAAGVDGCDLPPGFYVPSTERIGPQH